MFVRVAVGETCDDIGIASVLDQGRVFLEGPCDSDHLYRVVFLEMPVSILSEPGTYSGAVTSSKALSTYMRQPKSLALEYRALSATS